MERKNIVGKKLVSKNIQEDLRFSTSRFSAVFNTDTSSRPHPQQFKFRMEVILGARDRLSASS